MKVSIITVCLNAVKTIRRTIESVLSQTYEEIEYIVIDGMSTDGTWDIILEYKEKIDCVIHETDSGLYDAMNKGISRATGDIVGIINADDWYEKDAVERIVDYYTSDIDAEIVYGNMWIWQGNVRKERYAVYTEDLWYRMIAHPTVFVRKTIYDKYGQFDLKYKVAADYELILRLYSRGVNVNKIDKDIANFQAGGISETAGYICDIESYSISMKYLDACEEKYKYTDYINSRLESGVIKALKSKPDLFKNIFTENKPIAIYGAGIRGKVINEALINADINVDFWIDADSVKQGSVIEGKPVIPPISADKNMMVIISVKGEGRIIKENLINQGFKKVFCLSDLVQYIN